MSKWRDEIETAVDTGICYVPPVQTSFTVEEFFKLVVNVLHNRLKAERNIHKVNKFRAKESDKRTYFHCSLHPQNQACPQRSDEVLLLALRSQRSLH